MVTLHVLYVVLKKEKVEILRWVELPNSAKCASNKITWTTGFGPRKTQSSIDYAGAWAPLGVSEFEQAVTLLLNKLGLVPLGLRQENARRAVWSAVELKAGGIAARLATPMRVFLILEKGGTLPGVEVDLEAHVVVPEVDASCPMCFRGDDLDEPPSCRTHESSHDSSLLSLPPPGYWPVARVFVRSTQRKLGEAIQGALEASPKLSGISTTSPDLVLIGGGSTFLRDYWINLLHGSRLVQESESLSTTKNGGLGFADNRKIVNAETTDPGSAAESGFGFGGNFLTCHVGKKVYLFHGGCAHQVGGHADDRFMLERLLSRLRRSIEVVTVDTGWLKVGHVDEIMSFPAPETALLASPALYAKLTPTKARKNQELNALIERKLTVIGVALEKLQIRVIPLPVWFAPVDGDPVHVTSVRGDAVNCVYIGAFSIHSQSGPGDDEERPHGASSVIDAHVAEVMKSLGYTSLFVNMTSANDEGGAGGNVHCATYTIHLPP